MGRKMAEPLARAGYKSVEDFTRLVAKPDYDQAADLADKLSTRFSEGHYSKIVLVYNHFINFVSQQVTVENFLPFEMQPLEPDEWEEEIILEPDKEEIVKRLLPEVLRLKIYSMLLESSAAENAARTIAMQTASDNAQELLEELTLEYNKGRQQKITNEILDLIGGAQQ
jgi:F-type H+-transporting ATPase subunit gamma